MKLNHECVRDVLICIEENLHYGCYIDFSTVELKNYSSEDLLYTAAKLLEAGFLNGEHISYIGSSIPDIRITSITWEGHQFLDNIRDDNVWKNTKNVLSKLSSASLSMVGNIASQIISSMIQKQLGI